jgi:hypothetical protein
MSKSSFLLKISILLVCHLYLPISQITHRPFLFIYHSRLIRSQPFTHLTSLIILDFQTLYRDWVLQIVEGLSILGIIAFEFSSHIWVEP